MGQQENLGSITKLLGKLTTKSVPSWDISEKGSSVKAHIRRFENAIGGAEDMSEEEKAREFIATMRGSAAIFVEELGDETKKNYDKLKEELLSTFHKEKSVSMLMKEFNASRWRKNKQSIREFAAVLNIMWRKIEGAADDKDSKSAKTSEAILKNRLLDAIKEADPKFGSSLEFYITDSTLTFKELASKAELKYDLYKENSERIAESEWDKELMFLNAENQSRERSDRNDSRSFRSGNQSNNQVQPRYNKPNDRSSPWMDFDGPRVRENWPRQTNQNWRTQGYRDIRPRRPAIGYDRRQFQEYQNQRENRYPAYTRYQEDRRSNNFERNGFNNNGEYHNRFQSQQGSNYRYQGKRENRSGNQINMDPEQTQGTVVKRTENVQFLEGKEKGSKNL